MHGNKLRHCMDYSKESNDLLSLMNPLRLFSIRGTRDYTRQLLKRRKVNRRIITILIFTLLASCHSTTEKPSIMEDKQNQTENTTSPIDTTPKVTGIGGIFFYSDNPQETKDWYAKNMGFEINDWGSSSFDSRDLNRPDEINSFQIVL